MVMQRIIKPKNQRVKRALEAREAKVKENNKKAMFIKGGHTSECITQVLKELSMLKKPDAVLYRKKNILRPFDDATSVEFFSQKSDCSLFAFGCHSKKRPHNIIFGRCYDFHILDMVEMGVENFKSLRDFQNTKISMGTKPCLLFAGEAFDNDPLYSRVRNLFIDFFRGPVIDNVRLQGLEHVLQFTVIEDGKINMRSYRIMLKKSGRKTPRVELEEIGPSLDLVLRRNRLASDDLFKRAKRTPKVTKPTKKKNISFDPFGTQHGRIHMQSQDLSQLQTRKMKGLKRKAGEKEAPEAPPSGETEATAAPPSGEQTTPNKRSRTDEET